MEKTNSREVRSRSGSGAESASGRVGLLTLQGQGKSRRHSLFPAPFTAHCFHGGRDRAAISLCSAGEHQERRRRGGPGPARLCALPGRDRRAPGPGRLARLGPRPRFHQGIVGVHRGGRGGAARGGAAAGVPSQVELLVGRDAPARHERQGLQKGAARPRPLPDHCCTYSLSS